MPIRPEFRKFYSGAAWRETRARILARAGNECEQCGKPNGEVVETVSFRNDTGQPFMLWRPPGAGYWCWHGHRGLASRASHTDEFFGGPAWRKGMRRVRVVLTIAHLNHVPGDNRDENLKALCQWCHLNYDKLHHKETRSIRKDRARPLLREAV